MALTYGAIRADEADAFRDCLMTTFGHDEADADPGGAERMRVLIAPGQAWAAFDDGLLVGTAGTFDHAIGVPGGGSLRMAGLTMVAVRPTHRRRGILRALVRLHLDDAQQRGYPVSGLWASEGAIYGRFGYGIAAYGDAIDIKHAHALTIASPGASDTLAMVDEATARAQLPAIYAEATALRPGVLRRSDVWWRERRFLEVPFVRGGASRRRHVIARREGANVGYVAYRQRPGFLGGVPSGKAEINELVGIDAQAEAALWRYMLALDLHPHVTWWNAPVDNTLTWLVEDQRPILRTPSDTLWLRVEDVPATLAARRYSLDGTLRFAIDDTTWQLAVQGGQGHCEPTAQPAELRLSRAMLGALFLGGTTASQLHRAGRIIGDAGAIARADQLFASAYAPWCPEVF
ncbi:MAG: GNAT family N-acetyltransferase [Kofleriaceae bacterium]|nr:GNAT family N-acetyltransferase [Kofleriaceae bacterium]